MLRTLRTVRHLRPSQLVWRLRYAWRRRRNLRRGTPPDHWIWEGAGSPRVRRDFPDLPRLETPGPDGAALTAMLAEGRLELLSQTAELGLERPDWRLGARSSERLWTVTLHYHAWAFSLAEAAADESASAASRRRAAELFRHYVGDWIRRCGLERPGSTQLAWNSYAVATRIGSWIRAYRAAPERLFAGERGFEELFLRSLWQQASFLEDHLEWDLGANHLIRDLVGMALAGRFFGGSKARGWLERATALAVRHIGAQTLADGGHYERSPGYHLDVMADLLQLALVVEEEGTRAGLRRSWQEMAEWIAWMRHPDGGTAQFNDGAVVAADAVDRALSQGGELLAANVAAGPRRGGRHLEATGMVVWHGDRWSIFFDVGEIAAPEQPGHGHADTLSLECSYAGRRLIVDPGSFDYDRGRRREYDRGTESHNTVTVDGEDSSELWQIFRVGRRARPVGVRFEIDGSEWMATGSHDGFDHLPGRPRHRRTVRLDPRGILEIEDEVTGRGSHLLQGGLLVEEGWTVAAGETGWRLSNGELVVIVDLEGPAALESFVEERERHPDYGVEEPASRLGWRWRGELPFRSRVTLAGGDGP